jgi:hypothetical protein
VIIIERVNDEKIIVEISNTGGAITHKTVDKTEFDGDINEGDILIFENGKYKKDESATLKRRAEMSAKKKNILIKKITE